MTDQETNLLATPVKNTEENVDIRSIIKEVKSQSQLPMLTEENESSEENNNDAHRSLTNVNSPVNAPKEARTNTQPRSPENKNFQSSQISLHKKSKSPNKKNKGKKNFSQYSSKFDIAGPSSRRTSNLNLESHSQISKPSMNTLEKSQQQTVKASYIVDQQQGPFFKIQDAIDHAKSGSVIKINTGLYKENLVILEKYITLEAKDINAEVYVLGQKGPTILIKNEKEQRTVTLQGIRFTHKGSLNKRFLQNQKIVMKDLLKQNKHELLAHAENYHIQFERANFSETGDAVIMVKSGQVVIKKCLVNLNLQTRESQLITPALIVDTGSSVTVESCDFKGSRYFHTIGVILRKCNMYMKDTNITQFKSGGMMMYLRKENIVKVFKSRIAENSYFGIQILGTSPSPSIQYCFIEHNHSVGVQICASSKCSLRKNTISLNRNGIEVISSDPLIYENVIEKNYENGVMIKSIEQLCSFPVLRGNDIMSNKSNGVICLGITNKAKLTKNTICFNKMAGVKIEKSASVFLVDNDIYKNIFQGVLVVESSAAHIERNRIHENIKANIALGGEYSCNTSIINNKIYKGRCEGIFMIDCGRCIISRNTIKNNYDGILMIMSIPMIIDNEIESNKNHGVICIKDSRPVVKDNQIVTNKATGVYVRDKSRCLLLDNKIDGNEVGIVQERGIKNIEKILEKLKQEKKTKTVKEILEETSDPDEIDFLKFKSLKQQEKIKNAYFREKKGWLMKGIEQNNIVNDKLRLPYKVKCALI